MSWELRLKVVFALLALTLVLASLVVLSVDWPIRPLLAAVVMALLPGAAVVTRLPVEDLATAAGLAVAISLGIEAAGSLVLLWLRWWHPEILLGALAVGSTAVLLVDVRRCLSHRSEPMAA